MQWDSRFWHSKRHTTGVGMERPDMVPGAPGPKAWEALESRARARLLGDDGAAEGPESSPVRAGSTG